MSTHKKCIQYSRRKKMAKKIRKKSYDQVMILLFVIFMVFLAAL